MIPHWWHFDFFSSLPFWAALAVTVLLVRAAGVRPRLRSGLLLACSSALLLALPRFTLLHLGVVWAVAVATYTIASAVLRRAPEDRRGRTVLAAAGVALTLAVLAFYKYQFVQELLRRPLSGEGAGGRVLSLLGVSYFTFRAIHVLLEASKGTIQRLDLLTYLNYLTFFPAYISGPINRYAEFASCVEDDRREALGADLRGGAERIVHGAFKKFVLVPIVAPYILSGDAAGLAQARLPEVALGLYAYALYFFFDFAGYTDLAIGAGLLLGVRLPENFKHPFFQKNIRDLWSSWHMSLTGWLVDYLYWPLVRKLRNFEFFRPRPVLLSTVGMNVTFLACGLWHGNTWNFVLWGAYHGFGISAASVYQRQKRRIPLPWLQRYFQSRTSRVVGAIGTFHFFAAGLSLFVLDLEQLRVLATALFR
jgi:alginate O-acetyltransferase complex protein AlgI